MRKQSEARNQIKRLKIEEDMRLQERQKVLMVDELHPHGAPQMMKISVMKIPKQTTGKKVVFKTKYKLLGFGNGF